MTQTNNTKGTAESTFGQGAAIIGMSCMFPGARDLNAFWQNIVDRVDAVTDPPPEAWDSDIFYDPASDANDRVYCKKGGFLGPLAEFNPLDYGIMPIGLDGGEPDQWLGLKLAYDALADADYLERLRGNEDERRRTAVILGKGTYLNRGNLNMVQHSLVVDQTLQVLQSLHPEYGDEELALVRAELKRKLPPFDAASAPGLVPNIAAGRIANRLDLMGPSYTVDAACASSLIAVEIALRDLQTGRCDLALVGGAQVTTPIPILTLFSQLGALSHGEQIRPFDAAADGTILSEGIGMLLLKREEDARRDGDRIYAVIKGVGSSSDGRAMSVLTPRLAGEVLALQLAYENAGIDPATVGLIEAHGTGTLVGDATEIEALNTVFGERQGPVSHTALGTVKSMIGHTMPAAGVAGIIKAALALHNKVLPPTLHCEKPNPKLGLTESNFYLNTETRPWIQAGKSPRRAGVNAFGFGGVNAHVVLEEAPPGAALPTSHMNRWDSEVVIVAAADRSRLLQRASQLVAFLDSVPDLDVPGFSLLDLAWTVNQRVDGQPCRLAVVATSIADLRDKLSQAVERLEKPKTTRIKDVRGIYFFEEPFHPQGKLAFLFPGEGSQYPNMLADLAMYFPEVRTAFDRIDSIFAGHPRGYVPSDFIFPAPGLAEDSAVARQLWEIDGAVEAVLTGNAAMHALLRRLGIRPDAMVGHSTGEYSALLASGMIAVGEDEFVGRYLLNLNRMYEEVVQENDVPRAFMLAVGAGLDRVGPLVEQAGDSVFVGMDNCPHQSVVVGDEEARASLTAAMKAEGLIFESLPFDRAYHTPLFQPYSSLFETFYTQLPLAAPAVTTYSCVTTAPFGDAADDIRTLAVANWVNRVRFRETIQAMYDDGVRIFVEVGARGNLTSFVGDTLRGQPHLAVPANIQQRSGITQLNHLVALLCAQGVPVNLDALYARRRPQAVNLAPGQGGPAGRQRKGALKLASGWAGMEISAAAAAQIRSRLADKTVGATEVRQHSADPGQRTAVASMSQHEEEKRTAMQHPPNSNGNHAPQGGQRPSALSPDAILPLPAQAAVDGRTLVMQGHLQLMDQFLRTQEALVQQFLTGVPARGSAHLYQPSLLPIVQTPAAAPMASAPAPQPLLGMPAAEPEPVVPSWTMPASEAMQPQDLKEILLHLVSDKTGYPVEVLSLDANLEADLGIDSIKRVEILGAFNQETGLVEGDTMEKVSSLKTLGAILDFFQPTASPLSNPSTGWPSSPPPPASPADLPGSQMPFIRDVRSHTPGEALEALCTLDVAEDLFMRDHTLGREVSRLDPQLLGLPVVPLTITMEIMAEAAAVLAPGMVLTGMRNLRAFRWIILEQGAATLHVTARRRAGAEGSQFDVAVRVLPDATTASSSSPLPAVAEGIMVFAPGYPEPPAAAPLVLQEERPSQWQPELLYRDGMFHGPSFRAVKSIERVGSNGLAATMEALPSDRFLRSNPTPGFIAEPILLDAAGQLVGFWTLETLEQGFVVFPYHLEALHFYGPPLPAGEQVTCQVHSRLLENLQMTSDIDILDEAGRLRMRLAAWDDKRFDIPRPFYRFILGRGEARLSTPWAAPLAGYPAGEAYRARKVSAFPTGFFQAHYGLWEKTLAYLVLTPAERQVWRAMTGADRRRIDWLLGRVAAKEALAEFLEDVYNLPLKAADIAISTDERGSPYVAGDWLPQMAQPLALTIAHAGGVAVAVTGAVRNDGRMPGIGVDLEPVQRQDSSFADVAFTKQEQSLLADLGDPQVDKWPLRAWCAKEAVGKALGYGLAAGPHSVAVEQVDTASGFVHMSLAGTLVDLFPNLSGEKIAAYTARENGYVLASVLGR